ncbi:metalloproteinase inhibitor 2-like [Saccostrea echinata]|uniref:metalloproteinase inhibitor 2-like n=1 Tax=Saccostrea echinata TaxID=191078 RepID=UPI002A7EB62C|nr:metalloproteinase inhibitor 2-like [Saccostrea echinata]
MQQTDYLFGFLILANAILVVFSCSCVMQNPYNGYCESENVLVVRALKLIEHERVNSYEAEIVKVFKSKEPLTRNTTTLNTAKYGSLCGTSLPLNQPMMISPSGGDYGGFEFRIGLCDSIRMKYSEKLENFGEDLDCSCRVSTGGFGDSFYPKEMLCPWIGFFNKLSCPNGDRMRCSADDNGECQWRCKSENFS